MSKIKATQQSVDSILNHLSHLKARLSLMDGISRVKESPGWDNLKKFLKDRIDMFEKDIVSTAKYGYTLEDRERCRSIDQKSTLQAEDEYFIDLVEKTEGQAEMLRQHIQDLETELAEKRQEIAEFA